VNLLQPESDIMLSIETYLQRPDGQRAKDTYT